MRAALILTGELSEATGGFLYDRQLVSELRRQGITVEVVSLPWDDYARQIARGFDRRWRDRLHGLKVDFILQDELAHPTLALLNRRAFHRDSPPRFAIVHHLRWLEQHPPLARIFYRWLEAAYLRTMNGFVYNSRHTRTSVQSLIGSHKPGIVAYPGRDHLTPAGQPAARSAPNRPLELLFVGGLIPRKGLHTLLQALARIDVGWRLEVVGRRDLQPGFAQRMLAAAEELGRERVHFHGHLDASELAERYRRADLLVVPSQLEGFGLVYLEAMGFGVPVVASANGGAAEFVEHGRNGFLTPADDPARLADLLRSLLQQPERLREMANAARASYRAHPTWRETAETAVRFVRSQMDAQEVDYNDDMNSLEGFHQSVDKRRRIG